MNSTQLRLSRLLQRHRACPSVALDKKRVFWIIKQYIISRSTVNVNTFYEIYSPSALDLIFSQSILKQKDAAAPQTMQTR